jgi:hypothetical protein
LTVNWPDSQSALQRAKDILDLGQLDMSTAQRDFPAEVAAQQIVAIPLCEPEVGIVDLKREGLASDWFLSFWKPDPHEAEGAGQLLS